MELLIVLLLKFNDLILYDLHILMIRD